MAQATPTSPNGHEARVDAAPDAPPELMTAEQVAALLLLPRSTVEGYARSGVLPSIKIGKHRRFVRTDVVNFIDALRRPPPRAPRQSPRRRSA